MTFKTMDFLLSQYFNKCYLFNSLESSLISSYQTHKTHPICKNLNTNFQNITKRQLKPCSFKVILEKSDEIEKSKFSLSNLIVLNLSLVRVELWHFWQKSNQRKVRVSGFDAHRKPAGHWIRRVIGLVDSGTRFMRTVLPEFVELPFQKGLPFPLLLFVHDNEFSRWSCFSLNGKFIVVYFARSQTSWATWSITNLQWSVWYF